MGEVIEFKAPRKRAKREPAPADETLEQMAARVLDEVAPPYIAPDTDPA